MTIQLSKTAVIVLSVGSAVVLLFSIGVVCYYHGFNRQDNERKAADERDHRLFREKYLPQVGRQISIAGRLQDSKGGWWVSFEEEGLSIYMPSQEPDPDWFTQLTRLVGRNIRATGVLYYDGRYFHLAPNRVAEVGP